MSVIWKRPDGFHGASPSDYYVIDIKGNSKVWLHKHDDTNYPFRVSGGWQDEDATCKLNKLVNLLARKEDIRAWINFLQEDFNNSTTENSGQYYIEIIKWLQSMKSELKGDNWEVEIMSAVLEEVEICLQGQKKEFTDEQKSKD